VNEENVLPFDPSPRSGMARRGAPDKTEPPPVETLEVECPFCSAVVCLEARIAALSPEILCAGCDSTIPVDTGRVIDVSR
jgi:hypothetical protein